jgi:hypothetical protein
VQIVSRRRQRVAFLNITFGDPRVALLCNSAKLSERCWGAAAAADVRAALSVLAAMTDIAAYLRLPNVRQEGDQIVFQGITAEVELEVAAGDPRHAHITAVDARIRVQRT